MKNKSIKKPPISDGVLIEKFNPHGDQWLMKCIIISDQSKIILNTLKIYFKYISIN